MMMEDEVKTKAIISVATFTIGFLSAIVPMRVIYIDAHLFSAGNLMSSGVLLSAGIVHQLPDSMKKFELSSLSGDFPVAPFITGLTFCVFLILEEYIHTHFDDNPFESSIGFEGSSMANEDNNVNVHKCNGHKSNGHAKEDDPLLQLSNISRRRKRSVSDDASRSSHLSCAGSRHGHHHDLEHVVEHIHGSLLSSVILLLALSVHSIFDGLAIGISSNLQELISTTAAVLAHKGFAGYALGSSMVASEMNEAHHYALSAVFASCSVIGIILGTIFEQWGGMDGQNEWKTIGSGSINAIVAGTFLYISIVEIGLKELLVCRDSSLLGNKIGQKYMQWSKLVAFLLGYLAMSSLALYV